MNLDFSDSRLFALARAIGMPLIRSDASGELSPGLAESWQTPDGGQSWMLTMRTGENAPDAASLFTVRVKQLLQGTQCPLRAQLMNLVVGAADYAKGQAADVSGMVASGGGLELKLTRPNLVFPLWLSQPGLYLIDNDSRAFPPVAGQPIGGWGPFLLAAVEGDALALKENQASLDGMPVMDKLRFVCEPDRAKQLERFRSGELDAANVTLDMTAAVEEDVALAPSRVWQDTARPVFAVMDHSGFPWGDSEFQEKLGLRQAVNWGLNREDLEAMTSGRVGAWPHFFPKPLDQFVPPGLISQPTYPLGEQLEAAREALKQADHDQGSHLIPGMDLMYLPDEDLEPLAIGMLEYWNDISVRLRPFPASRADLLKRVGIKSHELILCDPAPAYADPDALAYPLLYSALPGLGGNWSYLAHEQLDTLIRQAQAEQDPVARQKLYQELSTLLDAGADFAFVGYSRQLLLINPELAGYALTPYDFDASLPAQDFAKLGWKGE